MNHIHFLIVFSLEWIVCLIGRILVYKECQLFIYVNQQSHVVERKAAMLVLYVDYNRRNECTINMRLRVLLLLKVLLFAHSFTSLFLFIHPRK